MTTDALLIAAFIGLDAGAVMMALGWLGEKRRRMDRTDLKYRDDLRRTSYRR